MDKRIFDDVYVNEVLDLLDGSDMQAEKENLLNVLSKIDGMYELIQAQEKSIHDLENEVQKLSEPKAKRMINAIISEAKEEYNVLKNKLIDLKETVMEKCKFLVETFKASGKFAFFKALEETCGVFKDVFNDLRKQHMYSINNINSRIERIISIRNEWNMTKGHFKNVGRLIMGKEARNIDESKYTPAVLAGALNYFEKNKHISEKIVSIDNDCISKLNQLEKTFADKSREKKKTLDDMIARASEKRQVSVKDKTNELMPQQGR